MAEQCPHCGGRLIEKHEEEETEMGKTVVYVFSRCARCGRRVKRPRTNAE